MDHKPRYKFDCKNCKFNWNCGYVCACALTLGGQKVPEPPVKIQLAVNKARVKSGYEPKYKIAITEN